MRLKKYLRWQLDMGFKNLAMLYAIVLAAAIVLFALFGVFSATDNNGITVISNTTTTVNLGFGSIYLFVVGIVYVYYGMRAGLANSVSRKTIIGGQVIAAAVLAAAVTIANLLIGGIAELIASGSVSLYFSASSFTGGQGATLGFFGKLMYSLMENLLMMALGMLFGAAYYRMNKAAKIIVSVGVPTLLIFGIPLLSALLPAVAAQVLGRIAMAALDFLFQTPTATAFSMFGASLVCFIFAWVFLRRTPIKAASK